MTFLRCALVAALATTFAYTADARPLKLKLANPQPEAVTAGLSVQYAYPDDVKSLRDAYIAIGIGAEPGAVMDKGLNYISSDEAPMALTSNKETKVAAQIKGYIKFDAPGVYKIEVFSNDGLELTIGGQEVAKVDEKRGCDPIGEVEVNVREAGYYEVEALYWQRKGSSCLQMQWAPEGAELDYVPASAFGH
ncbi:MAG: PA14 domain-containing protein [Pseudomonadota bacterium]